MPEEEKKTIPFKYNLAESSIAGAFNTQRAFEEGQNEADIRAAMLDQGEDQDDIDLAIRRGRGISELYEVGVGTDDVRDYLVSQLPEVLSVDDLGSMDTSKAMEMMNWDEMPDELVQSTKTSLIGRRQKELEASEFKTFLAPVTDETAENHIYSTLRNKIEAYQNAISTKDMSMSQYLANYKIVRPNTSSFSTRTAALFGNRDAERIANETETAFREQFIKAAKEEHGLELHWVGAPDPELQGAVNEQGDEYPDPDIGIPLYDDGYWVMTTPDGQYVKVTEDLWDSLKSEEGAITGAVSGGMAASRIPVPHPLAKLGAVVVGGAFGAAFGSTYDTFKASQAMHEEVAYETYAHNALNEAQLGVLGDVGVLLGIKGIGATWRVTRDVFSKVLAGNKQGARIALREEMKVADDVAEDILDKMERVANVPGEGSDKEIASFILTQPGGEEILSIAGKLDPAANRTVSLDIDTRAKDLLQTSSEISDENIGKMLREDLTNYTNDVKQFFTDVKAVAADAPNNNMFTFSFDNLGIKPVLEMLQDTIEDLPVAERFAFKMNKIMERVDGRSFTDLLDLRKTINSFRFGRGLKKGTERQMFKDLMINLDTAIEEGAEVVLENPEKWLTDWKSANSQYAQMKTVEKNILFKTLARPGISESVIAKSLTKYMSAIDETWTDVMAKLPKLATEKAEGAVMNAMTNKYTAGLEGGLRATNFPMLAAELEKISFVSKEARELKGAISRLAEVFKNDVPLSQQVGAITIPKNQSYLTTDPIIRMKYEFASSMFNKVKELMPTRKSRALALMMRTTKLLENPLDVKLARELMKEVGEDLRIAEQVLELQRAAARQQDDGSYVKLFGKDLKFKGEGQSIRMHRSRIATREDIVAVQQAGGIHKSDTKATNRALKEAGFQAKLSGTDRVEKL